MKITVRNNDVNQALKVLKRKLQQEGVLKEMRRREAYEKPSEKRRREKAESVRRKLRDERKKSSSERGNR